MQFEIIRKSLPRSRVIKGVESADAPDSLTGSIFLYVGNNSELVKKLTTVFDFGYSAETLRIALHAIRKMEHQDIAVIQTIILDTGLNMEDLEELKKVLVSSNGPFLSVPVLYNVNKLNHIERNLLLETKIVDDLIDLEGSFTAINERVIFLRKIKDSIKNCPGAILVETNVQAIGALRNIVKRSLDIVISSFLILLLVPVFLIIAAIIKAESKGPVLYNAYRAGRGYQIFKFFRFRTMKVGADRMVNSIPQLNQNFQQRTAGFAKSRKDRRLTRSGSFLQHFRLDELPQLFNVLIGDMAIVGNKPLPLHEASSLTTDEWAERFIAPAGITGLWKIRRTTFSDMSVEERLKLDIDYARRHNLLMDFAIMLKTTKAFFL